MVSNSCRGFWSPSIAYCCWYLECVEIFLASCFKETNQCPTPPPFLPAASALLLYGLAGSGHWLFLTIRRWIKTVSLSLRARPAPWFGICGGRIIPQDFVPRCHFPVCFYISLVYGWVSLKYETRPCLLPPKPSWKCKRNSHMRCQKTPMQMGDVNCPSWLCVLDSWEQAEGQTFVNVNLLMLKISHCLWCSQTCWLLSWLRVCGPDRPNACFVFRLPPGGLNDNVFTSGWNGTCPSSKRGCCGKRWQDAVTLRPTPLPSPETKLITNHFLTQVPLDSSRWPCCELLLLI